ncbi:MAG: hypothetical protein ACI97A_002247 [Planctomycetota bacterium]|jgi:hypothetical protein
MAMNDPREQKEAYDGGVRSKIAANVVLVSALAILLVVFINFGVKELGKKRDLRFDLTDHKSLALTDTTKGFVRGIKDPVRVYLVFGIDDNMKAQARRSISDRNYDTGYVDRYYRPILQQMVSNYQLLMEEVAGLNSFIDSRLINSDVERDAPVSLQRELGMGAGQMLNHVVFYNVRTKAKKSISLYQFFDVDLGGPDPTLGYRPPSVAGDFIEARILIGLRSVVERKRVRIGVADGHGERKLQGLLEILQNDNFEVGGVKLLAENPKIPQDCDVFLIFSPTRAWPKKALAELSRYVEEGGRVFLAQGKDTQEPFSNLLERFGVKMLPVQIGHETLNISRLGHYWLYGAEFLRPQKGRPHVITEASVRDGLPVDLGASHGYELFDDYERDRVSREVIMRSTNGAIAMPWRFDGSVWRQAPEVGVKNGDFPLMVVGEIGRDTSEQVGKIVVVGSDDWLNEGPLRRRVEAANLDLMMNSIYWLTDIKQFIMGTPRQFRGSLVNLEGGREKSFLYLTVAIIPGLILLMGALMFFWRRR